MPTLSAPAAETFDWKRWPETEAFVAGRIASALAGNAFAANLAGRMARETSTRFSDWVDHLVIGEATGLGRTLGGLATSGSRSPTLWVLRSSPMKAGCSPG